MTMEMVVVTLVKRDLEKRGNNFYWQTHIPGGKFQHAIIKTIKLI